MIRREDVEAAQAARRGRPLFLIDIAVPRDVAEDAGKVSGVFLYDIDDLKTVAEANLRERKKEASAAEAIVEQEIREFLEWRRSLEVVPLLVELRKRADEIRRTRDREGAPAARPAHPGAGEGPRGRDDRDRQQAPPRPHRAAQADGRERPARARGLHPEAVRPVSRIRIGTRGSALALWQAEHVEARLAALGHAVELRVITTTGDRLLDRRLESVGGKGAFLKEIEDALLAGEVDLAVHSLKDVPTVLPDGLSLCAILERADPRDALLSSGPRLASCRRGPRWARRACGARRWCARCARTSSSADLRGNVDTRIKRLREGRFDAILLAMAGLTRLGRAGEATEALDPRQFVPAPGQGAIALECRDDDAAVRDAVAPLDHAPTARAVAAERAFLEALGGGCNVPLGRPRLRAWTAGSSSWPSWPRWTERACCVGSAADRTRGPRPRAGRGPALAGRRRAARALRMGTLAGRRIVLTRRRGQSARLGDLLGERGAAVLEVPAIEVVAPPDTAPLDEALLGLERYQWVVLTSANAVAAVLGRLTVLGLEPRLGARGPKIASVGPATDRGAAVFFPRGHAWRWSRARTSGRRRSPRRSPGEG